MTAFRNFQLGTETFHTRSSNMTTLPPTSTNHRSPRAQLASYTPAVVRLPDGRRSRGELQVISVTGGLLSLPHPLDRGSHVSLMFLTQKGAVQGAAEMLRPVSWASQPFRFISLDELNRCRLKTAVQWSLSQKHPEYDWVDNYRAKLTNRKPPRKRVSGMILAAATLAVACLGSAIIYGFWLR